jgi:purine nucleosidase
VAIEVVLDTDIGDNFDDAFSLGLACMSSEIELLGVTTTSFQPESRSILARRVLGLYGVKYVQVSTGNSPRYKDPMHKRNTLPLQLQPLARPIEPMAKPAAQEPIAFLKDILRTHQGITYVANAPLTNLAAFLTKYPHEAGKIKQIVLMGGWCSQALPEWNIQQDPEAAQVILRSNIPIIALGYEVTLHCNLSEKYLDILHASSLPGTRFLMSCYRVWAKETAQMFPPVHDPLTIAYLCEPSLVQLTTLPLNVETETGPGYGVLYRDEQHGYPVYVATDVKRTGYLEFLVRRLTDQDSSTISSDFYLFSPSLHIEVRNALEITYPKDWRLSKTPASKHMLGMITQGEGCMLLGDKEYPLCKGSLLYIPKRCAYAFTAQSKLSMLTVYFEASQIDKSGEQQALDRLLDWSVLTCGHSQEDLIRLMLQRIVEHWKTPEFQSVLKAQGLLIQLLAELSELSLNSKQRGVSHYFQIVSQAKSFLKDNVEANVTLDQLSDHLRINKFHLINIFKQVENTTPMQYYRFLKITRAAALLESGHLPVKQVAYLLGYSSVQSFTRVFKKEMGLSPTDYIKLNQGYENMVEH